mmetsp:Transcript_15040/g.40662  ORF Transcript_15040/g.40662 Transcript_15040/m.40662 type:complete len:96 (-) Transcript_15040:215-502(-)|eukprot:1140266-Pelagomonas_calceolata.AAC.2
MEIWRHGDRTWKHEILVVLLSAVYAASAQSEGLLCIAGLSVCTSMLVVAIQAHPLSVCLGFFIQQMPVLHYLHDVLEFKRAPSPQSRTPASSTPP